MAAAIAIPINIVVSVIFYPYLGVMHKFAQIFLRNSSAKMPLKYDNIC